MDARRAKNGDSLTARAFRVLHERLLYNAITPGEMIDDAALARELGMSRTPIRESLLALEQRGLVRIVPRVGHFATEITPADVVEAYEVRLLLEPAIAAFAAQRITPDEVTRLRGVVGFGPDEINPAVYSRAVALNREFHVGIALASGNRRLSELYANLMDNLTRIVHYELSHGFTSGAWRDEHLTILAAIESHDEAEASRIVRGTILDTHVMMRKGVWLRFRDVVERDQEAFQRSRSALERRDSALPALQLDSHPAQPGR
ncbi:MAG TPA: GntR family transcriptional regulator [Chloroflexota bacterium]|nr:GntR family transcriptional regulator [Chloroflexota bacterium]